MLTTAVWSAAWACLERCLDLAPGLQHPQPLVLSRCDPQQTQTQPRPLRLLSAFLFTRESIRIPTACVIGLCNVPLLRLNGHHRVVVCAIVCVRARGADSYDNALQ
jgi:hypothetical protein